MTDTAIAQKAQGTFDLGETLEGRGFPTLDKTVYTNAQAAFELAQVQARLEEIAQDRDALTKGSKSYKEKQAEFADLEKQAEALKQDVLDSALHFHLRGISPGHLNQINRDVIKLAEEQEWDPAYTSRYKTAAWCAPHIIRVTNAEGAVDSNTKSIDDVLRLMDWLPDSQWNILDAAIGQLSFDSAYFDAAVDPGFLQKS